MAFPDASRVIYERNPLEEVICQIRFPALLKIDTESPAAFQEGIRGRFPFYKNKPILKLPPQLSSELLAAVARDLPFGVGNTAHEFTSRDEKWTLTLTRDFLALTCREYRRWEEFKEQLSVSLETLRARYAPSFFTRLGLRYRDVIRRSVLGLEEVPWGNLLKPWIAGALHSGGVAEDVEHTAGELCIRLSDNRSRVRAQYGLVLDGNTKESCYLIDADFFTEQQVEPTNALNSLDFLNHQSRLFFRWCIEEQLHHAMGPCLVLAE